MIKTFCDCCEQEITEENALTEGTNRRRMATTLIVKNKSLSVEVITGQNSTSNAGDFCKYCVLDALYELDDRRAACGEEAQYHHAIAPFFVDIEKTERMLRKIKADIDNAIVKEAVDRFLQWPMPPGFGPDGGISFTRQFLGSDGFKDRYGTPFWPIGTNLFDAVQAEQMFRHCLNLPTKE